MYKLNCFIIALAIFCASSAQNNIKSIVEYKPAPGQYINIQAIGTPSAANSLASSENNFVTLGNFGGYIVFSLKKPVVNHLQNPYGVDFSVFGNAFQGSSEPGVISVSKDTNHNGIADDEWFEIAGSHYFKNDTKRNRQITYYKINSDTIRWTSGLLSGTIVKNVFNKQNYYPESHVFTNYPADSVKFNSTYITAEFTESQGIIKLFPPIFGYADSHGLVQGVDKSIPDNPYTQEVEGAGGDPVDISWAVDKNGVYVTLDTIHFIKIATGSMADLKHLGELSTEVSSIVATEPTGTTGKDRMLVFYRLPEKIVLGDSIRPQAVFFEKGRKVNTAIDIRFSDLSKFTRLNNDACKSVSTGNCTIEASISGFTEIQSLKIVRPVLVNLLVDKKSVYAGDTLLLKTEIYDNLNELINIPLTFSLSDNSKGKIIRKADRCYFVATQPGEVNIECRIDGWQVSATQKIQIANKVDNIQIYCMIKTETECLLPLQPVKISITDINPFVENRKNDYNIPAYTLAHAIVSMTKIAGLNPVFRDDLTGNGKLYLYNINDSQTFTYGWGGKTTPTAYAKAWIMKQNGKQFLNDFQKYSLQNNDTLTLYHISDISSKWTLTQLIPSGFYFKQNTQVKIVATQSTCELTENGIVESSIHVMAGKKVVAGSDYFTDNSGIVSFLFNQEKPVQASMGNDAVLLSPETILKITPSVQGVPKVYPNPFISRIIIEGLSEKSEISIYSVTGKKIATQFADQYLQIQLREDLPPGMYLLHIRSTSFSGNFKLIKK